MWGVLHRLLNITPCSWKKTLINYILSLPAVACSLSKISEKFLAAHGEKF